MFGCLFGPRVSHCRGAFIPVVFAVTPFCRYSISFFIIPSPSPPPPSPLVRKVKEREWKREIERERERKRERALQHAHCLFNLHLFYLYTLGTHIYIYIVLFLLCFVKSSQHSFIFSFGNCSTVCVLSSVASPN